VLVVHLLAVPKGAHAHQPSGYRRIRFRRWLPLNDGIPNRAAGDVRPGRGTVYEADIIGLEQL
jgi:hypothetical protein